MHNFITVFKKVSHTPSIVIGCLLIASFLYTYNLNWGAPYYFHPDERNIISAVTRLRFPDHMNPEFFAYGSFPIYSIYFISSLISHSSSCTSLMHCEVPFEKAIIVSRMFSVLLGLGTLVLLFSIGKKLHSTKAGLLSLFFGVSSVGFMQFSHFGTFEFWLTFLTLALFNICIEYYNRPSFIHVFWIGILSALLISTKISSVVLLPLSFLTLLVTQFTVGKMSKRQRLKHFFLFLLHACVSFVLILSVYAATNPYVFIDTKSFLDSMHYESSVALGTLPVFYTGEFINTIPILFQFFHVFPFILNPILTIVFPCSFIFFAWISLKKKSFVYKLLLGFFVILFLSQAVLFVKWVRYMIPTLPFIYLMISISFVTLFENFHKRARMLQGIGVVCMFVSIVFAVSYFITVFVHGDSRVQARDFAKKNISSSSSILSEVYDLGIVPFNDIFSHIDLYNFYDLDNPTPETNAQTLNTALAMHDFIILPSQRIEKIRIAKKSSFPNGNAFYIDLLEGRLHFTKIYQTPCDIFCQIIYLGDPVNRFEETANVFDRPIVQIYQKVL